MLEKIQILLQYLLPKYWITYLVGLGASWKGGWITRYAILLFIHIYKIDMKESDKPNLTDYATFNAFFTRKLHKNARPIDTNPSTLIIPADGIITQIGKINQTNIFRVKNAPYHLDGLLAGHDNIIDYFINGSFVIIYIPPQNCHRIYMPCTGTLREVLYIPGNLFSVHPKITKNMPNIFSRNERVICLFETDFGYMAQILIGAIIVGSIETTWLGTITPPREGIVRHWRYSSNNTNTDADDSIILQKGHEMGLFKLGSTVINLFGDKKVILNNLLQPYDIARIGMPLAHGHSQKK
ncbi:phosphatidylserine decarboxylase proenzyme [Candidatus Blochmanniella pennsylvanica str. BPEN]|uniref:Phosphatidylserine decarboxylase proenzyme n=1 Tax=Blochmanniella pennsylvanica (strain BPEN) TaxID=291272 RepID=PSD_BLOPB|nr:archaetidylserine decarboxylase [Candidatus Blochmannia pennsylvanicus]Q493W4.1 RecName: Full=Phosphatidylserine decarboxylase proenzyme; Contains: RecName: Full=Phosphatidylserine decarboxylase alpha chain; Contains: RecName: Full=Phosphatidylserine decarboxylase beta chain [Candidatus Blochmannia pennsylvanicus str. BPEN]AAZ40720.1 phosphatidylserine decarboxylase proenzyme [Candidatus Blochmannia pennsylvanicus str. BPEN]UOY04504.1 archaetidylserine decarboxylase [Candidatus Blochmannia pe